MAGLLERIRNVWRGRADEHELEIHAGDQLMEPEAIEIVQESGWHQGFGAEFKTHIGRSDAGWHYGTMDANADDVSWSKALQSRDQAEAGSSKAYERWAERNAALEIAHEEREIARFEKSRGREHSLGMEMEP